ncbi:hypothetical protein DPEC_G00287840 [Dallia pectoralis]|uniref:Uncharacterized protein n=1 Tax=Dallia pectoralis TaxID=75939 RepID=A0ACC2FKB0_DALPE|nr:hypothetical protein DPEC_G00287840 [Dallia pectoralis]
MSTPETCVRLNVLIQEVPTLTTDHVATDWGLEKLFGVANSVFYLHISGNTCGSGRWTAGTLIWDGADKPVTVAD